MDRIQKLTRVNPESGVTEAVAPITYIDAVYDSHTQERLDVILNKTNHLYVPFASSAETTRLVVKADFRRKGLSITYVDPSGTTITETYTGDNSAITDSSWMNSINWTKEGTGSALPQTSVIGTYSEIKALKDSNKLIVGTTYIINDYQTIYLQPISWVVMTGEHRWSIVLQAISSNGFASDAYIAERPEIKIEYSIDNNVDDYSWATPTGKGVIYRMIDGKNVDLPYDFKSIKFRRWWMNPATVRSENIRCNVTVDNIPAGVTDARLLLGCGRKIDEEIAREALTGEFVKRWDASYEGKINPLEYGGWFDNYTAIAPNEMFNKLWEQAQYAYYYNLSIDDTKFKDFYTFDHLGEDATESKDEGVITRNVQMGAIFTTHNDAVNKYSHPTIKPSPYNFIWLNNNVFAKTVEGAVSGVKYSIINNKFNNLRENSFISKIVYYYQVSNCDLSFVEWNIIYSYVCNRWTHTGGNRFNKNIMGTQGGFTSKGGALYNFIPTQMALCNFEGSVNNNIFLGHTASGNIFPGNKAPVDGMQHQYSTYRWTAGNIIGPMQYSFVGDHFLGNSLLGWYYKGNSFMATNRFIYAAPNARIQWCGNIQYQALSYASITGNLSHCTINAQSYPPYEETSSSGIVIERNTEEHPGFTFDTTLYHCNIDGFLCPTGNMTTASYRKDLNTTLSLGDFNQKQVCAAPYDANTPAIYVKYLAENLNTK